MPHDRLRPGAWNGGSSAQARWYVHPNEPHVKLDGLTIERRWPRLIHAMQWVACLSSGEAESCVRDYLEGRMYSGEAVNHFGGTQAVLQAAAREKVRSVVVDQRRYMTERLTEVMKRLR